MIWIIKWFQTKVTKKRFKLEKNTKLNEPLPFQRFVKSKIISKLRLKNFVENQ
jgi:hypothetical protein